MPTHRATPTGTPQPDPERPGPGEAAPDAPARTRAATSRPDEPGPTTPGPTSPSPTSPSPRRPPRPGPPGATSPRRRPIVPNRSRRRSDARRSAGASARTAPPAAEPGLSAPPTTGPAAQPVRPAPAVPVPPVRHRAVLARRPGHQVPRARRDELVAARAPVVLRRRRPGHGPHHPVPVRPGLEARGGGRTQRHVVGPSVSVRAGHRHSRPGDPRAGLRRRAQNSRRSSLSRPRSAS